MYGSIIPDPNIYQNTGLNNPPNYGVTKAALEHYGKFAAVNLAKYGIRVNTISPGPFPNKKVIKNFQNLFKN